MSVAELVTIGAKIAEIGETLKSKRTERDKINAEISALEKELMPLVVAHSKIIAEVLGQPLQPPAPPPPPQNFTSNYTPFPQNHGNGAPPMIPPPAINAKDAKQRIVNYLDTAEPGTSAADVASALRMDPTVVRQIMADMARGHLKGQSF
jgi:hypothetical protein